MGFIPFRVGTLRKDAPITFDVYIPIGEKQLHYMQVEDIIDGDRIKNLKRKKVRKLYIRAEEEPTYLQYLEEGLDTLEDKNKSIEEKANITNDTMVTAAENADKSLESEQGFKTLEGQLNKVQNFLLAEAGALESVLGVSGVSDDIFQHCSNVSSMAVTLGQKLGIRDPGKFTDIGVAGLLHDFGKSTVMIEPLKPVDQMSKEELARFHKHPLEGCDALKGKQYVSTRVLEMIENHEEIGQGEGFPEKRNIKRLPKYCQVLNICNAYDRLCIQRNVPPLEAMEMFRSELGDKFDEKHVNALAEIVTKR